MNVVTLPNSRTSYLTVVKRGSFFQVHLVTPMPKRPIRTALAVAADRSSAVAEAERLARQRQLPVRL